MEMQMMRTGLRSMARLTNRFSFPALGVGAFGRIFALALGQCPAGRRSCDMARGCGHAVHRKGLPVAGRPKSENYGQCNQHPTQGN